MFSTPSVIRTRLPFSAIAAALLLLVGCTATSGPLSASAAVTPDRDARRFARLVADLADPAMQGRGPGTQGINRARDYLIERFKAAGLQPAFGDAYAQPFEIDLGAKVNRQSLEVIGPAGQIIQQPTTGRHYSALGMSANAAFEGEAVFVGYGCVSEAHGYDSYRHARPGALRGKVAVAFRYEPMDLDGRSLWSAGRGQWTEAAHLIHKAKWAAERGAVALLVVNPPWQTLRGPLLSARSTSSGSRADIPVLHVRSSLVERMVAKAGRNADATLKQWQRRGNKGTAGLDRLEGVTVRGIVEIESRRVIVANVGGVVPGAGALADQVVVIGAHYDHLGDGEVGGRSRLRAIHPGADDNASGVAGLVMLARRFAGRAVIGGPIAGESKRRTMLFIAFTGEERGRLGSTHLLQHLDDMGITPGRIVAMVNMDMIGRLRNNKLTIGGVGTGDRWDQLVESANAQVGLKLHKNASGRGRSDHATFYNQRVPVLFVFTGTHTDYHRPTDTADKVNAAGGVRVVDLLDRIAMDLVTEPYRLAFVQTKGPAGTSAWGAAMPHSSPEHEKTVDHSESVPASP
ncbi:MAG: M28 family peptidase [Phycisphaeraceae bacterium]